MIRYVKYIGLVFGSLMGCLVAFFAYQNWPDLSAAYEYRTKLSYENIAQSCESKFCGSNYYCFAQKYSEYLDQVGLTGINIGLKMGFNFLEEDRSHQLEPQSVKAQSCYALFHLNMNNFAINQVARRFTGLDFTYGTFLSSSQDFLKKAEKFSDGLLTGLDSNQGIEQLAEPFRAELGEKLFFEKKKYQTAMSNAHKRVQKKIDLLLELDAQRKKDEDL